MSKKEKKQWEKQNKELIQKLNEIRDSAIYFKNLADSRDILIDSSIQQTQIIIKITNEEVNNIKNIPIDSNVRLYTSDLEQYIQNRGY